MLWFLQHHLWGLAYEPVIDHGFHHAWREGYVAVNRAFADAVVDEVDRDAGAAVFFHDYHLYVAPRLVREARPETRLVHFVHIPWPGTDSWSVLPSETRRAIHDGLLANDVVGFHTRRWRRNFMRVAEDTVGAVPDWTRDMLGYDGRRVVVTAAPISVDAAEFDELAHSPAVLEAGETLARRRPEKLILRVDRTDPSKNIVRGFRALELYLDAHPEMHGRVGLLALLDPSRQDIPEYAEYVGAIQREARENGQTKRPVWPMIVLRTPKGWTGPHEIHGKLVEGSWRSHQVPITDPRESAARERARRRAHPLGERRRARGAGRLGALGEPV